MSSSSSQARPANAPIASFLTDVKPDQARTAQFALRYHLPSYGQFLGIPPPVTLALRPQTFIFEPAPAKRVQAARTPALKPMVTSEDSRLPTSTPTATPPRSRGRGGRRVGRPRGERAARTPKLNAPEQVSEGTISDSGTPTERGTGRGRARGRGRGRGGRPRIRRLGGLGRTTKRKREDSDDEEEGEDKDDTDASENFSPLPAQSRSGRKISKATYFTPAARESTGEQRASGSGPTKEKKAQKNLPKAVRASVCKNCGRGPSPGRNMIVYCDGCNTPWHQHCHDPPITSEMVQEGENEWLCADCEISREEKVQLAGKVSAEGMSLAEKRRYLQNLPPSDLVYLLLHATSLYPDLPILSAESTAAAHSRPAEEDTYDLYSDTDPLPYPRAGNGVPLPPEVDDIGILIDDDVETFSHRWGWENVDRDRGLGRGSGLVHVGA